MGDKAASPSRETRTCQSDAEKLYALKTELLAQRNEQMALSIFENLLNENQQKINSELILDVRDLLKCIFDTIGALNLLHKYQILLLSAINNSDAQVVDVISDYFCTHLDDEFRRALSEPSNIAVTIAFARRIIDFSCAESVALLVKNFAEVKMVQKELVSMLQSKSAEERFRIHQVTAHVMKSGGNLLRIETLIQCLADELDSGDILCQLNAIEIFADTASEKSDAFNYLLSSKMVNRLYKLFLESVDHPDAGFLFPAFLKFFGHLSISNIDSIGEFPKFLDSLFDMVYNFDRLDAALRVIAFDTLSAVGSSDRAKCFLDSNSAKYNMERAMNSFGAAIASGPVELRVRHIDALSMLLRPKSEEQEVKVVAVCEKWFRWLGEPLPSILLSYLNKPFMDIRLASLHVLLDLIDYKWIIETFYRTAGFMEYVLNRSTETEARGKRSKFELICKMIDKGSSIILPEDLLKLRLYQKEGPFYAERLTQIDMENE